MVTNEVRRKYLEFFKKPPRSHKEISPAPLVLPEDPTTLFTSSGMQQLVNYLKGEPHPEGKKLVDSQPSIRAQGVNDDIAEVGNNRHFTYFEMLGNWSLGDYFKKEQLNWYWEFLTTELGIPKDKLWVSVFEGDDLVPRDEDSAYTWEEIGVPKEKIFYYDVSKNWWSRSGPPSAMPEGEIGGPDSEVFYDFGQGLKLHEKSVWAKQKCHPNCDCGRFLEIGNSVFIQYEKNKDGRLVELPQKNVDFGGGLERITAVVDNTYDIYKIDVFRDYIKEIEKRVNFVYGEDSQKSSLFRIIADHTRASRALITEGIEPSNKLHGYVLRRLVRRATLSMRRLKGSVDKSDLCLAGDKSVDDVIEREVGRFLITLEKGLREMKKIDKIGAQKAFDLYQTYGFPLELTEELFEEKGQKIDREEFKKEFEKHQELSRTASAGMFKGGLADHSIEVSRLHTATHLIHAALRKVLGEHVEQKGSNITKERLRFDFFHPNKLTDEEIKKIEDLVNEQIEKDLAVNFEIKTLEEAKRQGALAFFGQNYDEKVKVYTIGPSAGSGSPFSREVCGGPHVTHLGEIAGHVRIIRQESAAAGVRRIYAVILPK